MRRRESPEHPDPRGSLLEKLAPVLEWYASERAGQGLDPEFCVFVDFWSMYQGKQRTEAQLAAFGRALGRMDEWYGHVGTTTLCMTKLPDDWKVDRTYDSRGWCFFELKVSSVGKKAAQCLDAGRFVRTYDGEFASKTREQLADQAEKVNVVSKESTLATLVQGFRRPPSHPETFDQV